jgi:sulfur-oxidizing protein SoxY
VLSQFNLGRRQLLLAAGVWSAASAAGAAQVASVKLLPDLELAFAARTFTEAIAALGGMPEASAQISLDLPQLAENGALVPITVSSQLRGTRDILILVDVNPQPVAACFSFPDGTQAYAATRIRMAHSGTVYVAVRTEEGLFATSRAIQVSVSGCG